MRNLKQWWKHRTEKRAEFEWALENGVGRDYLRTEMVPKRRKQQPPKWARQRVILTKDRRVILVEQGPLRKKAASECQRAMGRLQQVRADWKRFNEEDVPAFSRWLAQNFGALTTEIREARAQLREKEELMGEVEVEFIMGRHRTYAAAYAAVRKRQEQPHPPPPSEEEQARARRKETPPRDFDDRGEDPMADVADEMLFEDVLRNFMGIDPARMSDSEYDRMFREFREQMLGKGGAGRKGGKGRASDRKAEAPATEPQPTEVRIKELYRILVRRLHPDVKADTDAEVSALWHEVQQAYQDRNLERLEMLLAFTDIQTKNVGEQTTLGQMRAVLAELRRSYNAVMRSLRSAKTDVAWGFARMSDRSKIAKKMERELKEEAASMKRAVVEMDKILEGWMAPRSKRKKRSQPQFGDIFF